MDLFKVKNSAGCGTERLGDGLIYLAGYLPFAESNKNTLKQNTHGASLDQRHMIYKEGSSKESGMKYHCKRHGRSEKSSVSFQAVHLCQIHLSKLHNLCRFGPFSFVFLLELGNWNSVHNGRIESSALKLHQRVFVVVLTWHSLLSPVSRKKLSHEKCSIVALITCSN